MERFSLQFEGIRDTQLLAALLGAISVILLGAAVWHVVRGRLREGVIAGAAALGPVVLLPTLLGSWGVRYSRGDGRARGTLLAALLLSIATGLGAALWTGSRDASAGWLAVLGVQIVVAVGVFYSSVYGYLGTRRLGVLMTLRCLAILALLAVLFKPGLTFSAGDTARPPLPILIDRSASMGTVDEASAGDRYSSAVSMLNSQRPRLEKAFRPVWYHFAAGPLLGESLDDLAALKPAGPGTDSTNISAAIRQAASEYRDAPGLVLLTDGLHNVAEARPVDDAVEAGMPVYCVGVGSAAESLSTRRNVQIVSVDAPMEVVRNNVATLTVNLRLTGLIGAQVADVQLFEEGQGQPAATARVPQARRNDEKLAVELKWTPRDATGGDKNGSELRKLRVFVPPVANEAVTEDNAVELHVLVTQPRIRVLYVEGTMRPEYKFLKRLLDSDTNVQLCTLVRVSGNRFVAAGSVNGRRMMGLPATDGDFAMFDVIILGDLDATFLSRDQMERMKAFVNNGGGLLMIGGHNSFGPGGYGDTAIEQLLPVTVGTRSQPQETTPLLPQLTAEGEKSPIFAGLVDYLPGPGGRAPQAADKLPELSGCVTVTGAKPGASVLAVHPTRQAGGQPLVVLAVQQVGSGRSAAFAADTTWNWYMPMIGKGAASPYHLFWGQLVRWLANQQTKAREAQPQTLLRLDQSYLPVGGAVGVTAFVRDPGGKSADARLECQVTAAGKAPVTLPLSAARDSAGIFAATWQAQPAGQYVVKVTAVDAAGKPLGADELPLRVAPHSAELDRLARDTALLEQIAQRSGGRYVDLARLPELIDDLLARKQGQAPAGPPPRVVGLHNFTVLFALFAALLTAEWLLRRTWQLH